MSGSIGSPVGGNQGFASISAGGDLGPQLSQMLLADSIQPGSAPGYELCKTIYSYHPLGAKLADAPVTLAQSQRREIEIPVLGERLLIEQFERVWDNISRVGASVVLHNLLKTARIYGISALAVGELGRDPTAPLDIDALADADLYFNVLDPLNTAGSLVLNQDPNAPDFLKPTYISANGQKYHPSRTCVMMNEQPIYIEWTSSAFGFVGRSVYQRALYPLKTYLQSMITDQMVTQKAGLLVAKMESPGSIIDNIMQSMFAWKRGSLKSGTTGQVLSIGTTEDVATLNMQGLKDAAEFARNNMLKNIATSANMPASMVNNETLAEGFGEGSEDAKQIARYIDYVRIEAKPAYDFMDRVVQRRAWSPAFYETMRAAYPEYRRKPYETAYLEWVQAFVSRWPNLLIEPDSEKVKVDEIRFKSVVAMVEIMGPMLDPENKAKLISWAADNANEREELFASKLDIDEDSLRAFAVKQAETMQQQAEAPRQPMAFESET